MGTGTVKWFDRIYHARNPGREKGDRSIFLTQHGHSNPRKTHNSLNDIASESWNRHTFSAIHGSPEDSAEAVNCRAPNFGGFPRFTIKSLYGGHGRLALGSR